MNQLPDYSIHSSMVASSISITGMSSLIGYTRLHVAHLSAPPFLTSVTGVLQLGQARISSSSGSTGMGGIYDTFRLLWNNSLRMKLVVIAAVCVSFPIVAAAQTRPPISKAAEAYAQFLLAHHLEEREDENGAIAAYKRAMELDTQSPDIPAELAALYLRQSKVQEAM